MNLDLNFEKLVAFSFFSTLALVLALIFFATIQDFVLVPLYDIIEGLVNSGLAGNWILPLIETIDDIFLLTPTVLDWLWLLGAVSLLVELFMTSYYIKRVGYFSLISLLFWGTMTLLFIMNIYIVLSNWVLTEILTPIVPNLVLSTPFFSYYLTYAGIINTLIIVGCIIVNAVDFDFANYFQRKIKEKSTEPTSLGDEVA